MALGKLLVLWPLALISLWQAALVFVVCDPSGHGCFVALALTRRSSRTAFGSRLSLFVRLQKRSTSWKQQDAHFVERR